MKLRNILLAGIIAAGFASCDDYLDVESPSRYDFDYVFSSKDDAKLALNGLYAKLLSGDLWGKNLLTSKTFNSDIDFSSKSQDIPSTNRFQNFDGSVDGGDAKLWKACYDGAEACNIFIDNIRKSDYYAEGDEDFLQMLGEAVVLRTMFYHELIWYYGDVPFDLRPSYERDGKGIELFPITDRYEILDTLIKDIIKVAPDMKFADANGGVDRVSKEFAWAQIARLSLTCGGYSLKPDKSNPVSYGKMERIAPDNSYKSYYKTAADYCDSVITSGKHALTKSFVNVFVDECTGAAPAVGDDPIFEIPFTKGNSGSMGYIQGYKCDAPDDNVSSVSEYGKINSDARLHPLARFLFDSEDLRRNFTFAMWKYSNKGVPTFEENAYTTYNGKWSKMWGSAMGSDSEDKTGINFPYMRYADVLLMFAEAVNEAEDGVNGPNGQKAQEALMTVRERAFRGSENAGDKVQGYVTRAAASKESFLKAVLDERKFEFGGENMRWRDLVRNNIYGETVFYTFLRMLAVAEVTGASHGFFNASAVVSLYDTNGETDEKWDNLPPLTHVETDKYSNLNVDWFPNKQVDMLHVYNMYSTDRPDDMKNYTTKTMYEKWVTGDGYPSGEVRNSMFGYIRADERGNVSIIENGTPRVITDAPAVFPVLRYLMPYPMSQVQDSDGAYVNYYGY